MIAVTTIVSIAVVGTGTVFGGGAGAVTVTGNTVVVVKVIVLVKVTGTVPTDEADVYLVFVTGSWSDQRQRNRTINTDRGVLSS